MKSSSELKGSGVATIAHAKAGVRLRVTVEAIEALELRLFCAVEGMPDAARAGAFSGMAYARRIAGASTYHMSVVEFSGDAPPHLLGDGAALAAAIALLRALAKESLISSLDHQGWEIAPADAH